MTWNLSPTVSNHAPTVIVTGVNGFVGKHLAQELSDHGVTVIGIGDDAQADVQIAPLLHDYLAADLSHRWPDAGDVDAVVHLAGLAAVGPSFDEPQTYLSMNSAMVTHMCEHLVAAQSVARVVIVSSAAIYDSGQPLPLDEDSALTFNSPYGVSKALVENQASYYRSRGLDCVVARPFNHIGPGQRPGFLLPDLAQAVCAHAGAGTPLPIGDLTTRRDYTDVRDVAQAYRLMATSEALAHPTYNICTGRSISGSELLQLLMDAMHISKIDTLVDPSRLRPNDPDEIYGDSGRLKADTGWVPQRCIADTVADFVNALEHSDS